MSATKNHYHNQIEKGMRPPVNNHQPGQGRRPDQYENSAKFAAASVILLFIVIIILLITQG